MTDQSRIPSAHVRLDEFVKTHYDYLIVGGGTAGLVLATRLTENPNVTVGVIEAGKLRLDDVNVNGLAGGANMWNNPEYDWAFKTIPQKHTNNTVHHMVRGKFVGGSSGINYAALVCPSSEDIDAWDTHAPGWSWSELEPYYHKSQTLQAHQSTETRPEYFTLDEKAHGKSGPIQTSWAKSTIPIERALVEAFNNTANTKPPRDPYSGEHVGFSQHLYTIDRSAGMPSRSYATNGYFVPAANRPNLKLATEASVVKILLESQNEIVKATGVLIYHNSSLMEVKSKQEVIVSSSTIQSPRLLELSGIGNPEILRAAGVECIVNLPEVGENLHEHPMSCVTYELAPGAENITLDSLFLDQTIFQEQIKLLTESQEGLMSGAFGPVGFVPYATQVSPERLKKTLDSIDTADQTKVEPHERVKKLLSSHSAPSMELIYLPCYVDLAKGSQDQSKVMPGPITGRNACHSTLASNMYPVSRGSTHIERAESLTIGMQPFTTQPRIDLNILSHEADVDVIAVGMALADKAYQSPSVAGRFLKRVHPPPEINLQDPEQAHAYIRGHTMIFNHNSGTCSMGKVVDENLRVKGVQGLRVVDISVFPDAISANPMAMVYALAERAADLIKKESPLYK